MRTFKLITVAAATLAITLGACTIEVKEPKAKETPTTTTTQPAPPVAPAPVVPVVDGNTVFCAAWDALLASPVDSPERAAALDASVAAVAGVTDPAIRAGIEAGYVAITDEDYWNAGNAIDIACGGTGWGPYPGDNGPEV